MISTIHGTSPDAVQRNQADRNDQYKEMEELTYNNKDVVAV